MASPSETREDQKVCRQQTTMPRPLTRSVAALEGDADPSATDDDRSALSNSISDPMEDDGVFCDQLASYIYASIPTKKIFSVVAMMRQGKSLVTLGCDIVWSFKTVQNKLSYISDDELADVDGGKASVATTTTRKWLELVETKVDCGSLSQDEENKASNITSLIEKLGGTSSKPSLIRQKSSWISLSCERMI